MGLNDEEHRDLEIAELVAVDLRIHDRRYEVFTRFVPTQLREQVRVLVYFHERLLSGFHPGRVLGVVARADQRVAPREDLVAILGGYAGELADDDQRKLGRNLRDEVAFALRSDVIEDLRDDIVDLLLERRDHPWVEALADEIPQTSVAGRVHIYEHELGAALGVGDVHALRG
jgi:hypothetical protein